MQADWRVTIEDNSSVKGKIQPTSSTDVAERVPDPTEVGKTSKRSVSAEPEQLLRTAEPDQCVSKVKAESIPEMPTQRQRYSRAHTRTAGFLVFSMCIWKGR